MRAPPPTLGRTQPAAGEPSIASRLLFFVVAPWLLSLPQAFYRVGPGFTLGTALIWWGTAWLCYWWISEAATRVLRRALQPWSIPGPAVFFLGGLVSALTARWWHPWLYFLLNWDSHSKTSEWYFAFRRNLDNPVYVLDLLQAAAPGILLWPAVNWVFGRTSNSAVPTPVQSAAEPADSQSSQAVAVLTERTPRFFGRLVRLQGLTLEELQAVEAEDHYIKIHSARGTELIYYRFVDALEDLKGCDGLKLSRSAWVRRSAIRTIQLSAKQGRVTLVNGLEARVSHAHLALLRQAQRSLSTDSRSPVHR